MSTSTISTGQPEPAASTADTMGVARHNASLATKRHLESPIDGNEIVSSKIAKLTNQNNNSINTNNNNVLSAADTSSSQENGSTANSSSSSQILVQDSSSSTITTATLSSGISVDANSSELVTTSILARTLLTTNSPVSSSLIGTTSQYSGTDPLESLKSSLEALPAPAILDSPSYLTSSSNSGSVKTTIVQGDSSSTSLVGFASLLGPERCSPLATAVTTVLSPIDEDPIEWTNPAKAIMVNGVAAVDEDHHHHGMNPSISSLTSLVDHQLQQQLNSNGTLNGCGSSSPHHEVITEDENGKSYFNLGSAQDSTILARKSSTSSAEWGGGSCGGANSSADFDDAISSSSCDSISSEDLFNSGEEFDDDDDDEDELCTYKQQRSTVLHLSLCKLNKFRTNCVEPSLHRSVLICNTLRHIEQEIRNEDEAADESLKSRERLPSFWPSSSPPNNPGNPNGQNNCFPPPPPGPGGAQSSSQPQITDTRPNGLGLGGLGGGPLQAGLVGGGVIPSLGAPGNPGMLVGVPPTAGGHDPYLTPNPYNDAPYLSAYDYNPPRPTPFHTTSYDYEQDLLLPPPNSSPSSTAPSQASSQTSLMGDVNNATSSLLECDSGYSDDLDMSLSSYYYSSPIPPPVSVVPPPVVVTSSHPSTAEFNSVVAMPSLLTGASNSTQPSPISSSVGAIQVSSICSSSATTSVVQSSVVDCSQNPYTLQCSPSSFQQLPPSSADSIMATHLLSTTSAEHLVTLQSPQLPASSSPMEISDLGGDIGEIRSGTVASSQSSVTSSSLHIDGGAINACEYTMASSSSANSTCDQSSLSSSSTATTSTLSSTTIVSVVEEDNDSYETGQTSPHSLSPCNSPPHQTPCSLPLLPVSTILNPLPPAPSLLVTSTTTLSATNSNNNVNSSGNNNCSSSSPPPSALGNTFAQQECGLESRRSDLSRNVGNHYNNHSLPMMMDSLISPAYSSSSL